MTTEARRGEDGIMKQQIARMIQMLVVVLVALLVGAPVASAGTKWDRCVNRMNSRGDKVPDAKGRHCWDTDDDDDEDDDCCNGSKKSCGGKKSCKD
ncbi:MAG: hypothetical protein EBQ51_07845 [Verrucomicrobia bacterium]|nr:hypothetical protein [Pseudomonadota bacterium]NBY66964.1 hypothetical protein [Verrucomicrobiota bacterium]